MPVVFNGKKIIPAPRVSIDKEIRRGEDGSAKSSGYRIALHGRFIAYKGGVGWTAPGYPPDQPEYLNQDSRMAGLIDKMGALNDLFDISNEGKLLEIYPPDGSVPIKCNPRLLGISEPEGPWVEVADYTVSLEADKLFFGNHSLDTNITTPVDETWQLEQGDERGRTWRFTHNVSASAKRSYAADGSIIAQGWENARARVLPSLGIDTAKMFSAGVLDLNSATTGPYNYIRSENIDEGNGRYSVTETWLLFDLSSGPDPQSVLTPCIDSFSISARTTEDGRTRVTIEGTLTGLEARDSTTHTLISTKWTNAAAKFAALTDGVLLNRAQTYAQITLNPGPLNVSVGRNPETGVITYSREYDNRPSSLVSGAISETVQISDRLPSDIVAKIAVLNRQNGPILQDIRSKTEKSRTISIELVFPPMVYGGPHPSKPDVSPILTLYGHNGSQGFTTTVGPFMERNEENWQPRQNRYSKTVSWIYE
jgi:hypothetical protein